MARRCRPLLGTFVEISASGNDALKLDRAIDAAFDAMRAIQELMSVHESHSELSRLNREANCGPVPLSRDTHEVLRRALGLAAESGGAFDPTVAPVLALWGMLPAALRRKSAGTWRDVVLERGRRVRFNRPLCLDLGGIAKGFAVDRALALLRRRGIAWALVNAGGDLRAFGPKPFLIHLRHPAQPWTVAHSLMLREAALATSAPYFSQNRWRGRVVSHLVNPLKRAAVTHPGSVSVRAGECWLADALTKVVLNAPRRRAEAVLAAHNAEAFVLEA